MCIKVIQSGSKDIYQVTKIIFFYFIFYLIKESCIMVSKKILSITTVFNINDEQQISVLEWFLKDHVTLNNVMILKIQLYGHRNKLFFKNIFK